MVSQRAKAIKCPAFIQPGNERHEQMKNPHGDRKRQWCGVASGDERGVDVAKAKGWHSRKNCLACHAWTRNWCPGLRRDAKIQGQQGCRGMLMKKVITAAGRGYHSDAAQSGQGRRGQLSGVILSLRSVVTRYHGKAGNRRLFVSAVTTTDVLWAKLTMFEAWR